MQTRFTGDGKIEIQGGKGGQKAVQTQIPALAKENSFAKRHWVTTIKRESERQQQRRMEKER